MSEKPNLIIETYKDQLESNLMQQCSVFVTIGSPIESPRWINVHGVVEENGKWFLRFQSTQLQRIFFHIEISELHGKHLQRVLIVDYMWNDFRDFRNDFLRKNFPTIKI